MAAVLSARRERMLLWLLAFTQFTVIMDFMVMMPLSPQLMRAFQVGPSAISGAVSAYAWCAGLSGLLAATYIDRFSRKKLMLTMFCLFTLSNLGCALAPTFHALVIARAFAGLTGGVLSSITMAIIADVIPAQRRGAATGIVMTSFGMAAVAGVPAGVRVGAVESVVVMVVVEWGNHVNLLKIYRSEIYLNCFTMVCKRFFSLPF